jgi:hypothetical protein
MPSACDWTWTTSRTGASGWTCASLRPPCPQSCVEGAHAEWGQLVNRPQSGKFSPWGGADRKTHNREWIPACAESTPRIGRKSSGGGMAPLLSPPRKRGSTRRTRAEFPPLPRTPLALHREARRECHNRAGVTHGRMYSRLCGNAGIEREGSPFLPCYLAVVGVQSLTGRHPALLARRR